MQGLFDSTDLHFFEVQVNISSNPSVKTTFKRQVITELTQPTTHH